MTAILNVVVCLVTLFCVSMAGASALHVCARRRASRSDLGPPLATGGGSESSGGPAAADSWRATPTQG